MLNTIRNCANKLEVVLKNYLNCNFSEFGIKSNGCLDKTDWKSPINFALGYKYAESNKNPKIKDEIENFLYTLKGSNIQEIIYKHEQFDFSSKEEAVEYVLNTINKLENILNKF